MKSLPAHSRRGASGSYRWMQCPSSPAMEDKFKEDESPFAAEGTLAHSLGCHCLRTGENAIAYLFYEQPQFDVIEELHEARK